MTPRRLVSGTQCTYSAKAVVDTRLGCGDAASPERKSLCRSGEVSQNGASAGNQGLVYAHGPPTVDTHIHVGGPPELRVGIERWRPSARTGPLVRRIRISGPPESHTETGELIGIPGVPGRRISSSPVHQPQRRQTHPLLSRPILAYPNRLPRTLDPNCRPVPALTYGVEHTTRTESGSPHHETEGARYPGLRFPRFAGEFRSDSGELGFDGICFLSIWSIVLNLFVLVG